MAEEGGEVGGEGGEEEGEIESFELAILLISVGLAIGALARHLQASCKVPIPFTVVVLLIGVILELAAESTGHLGDAVLSVESIDPHLLLGAFLPGLIFESAFNSNYHIMKRVFGQAILLAGPGVLINTALTAIFVYYALPYGWNWSESVLFGAIISATDPVAVVALLGELGASKRLATLIEGESLLNDGSAFVLYMIALEFVKGNSPTGGEVLGSFLQLTFGGVLCGVGIGFIVSFWLKKVFSDAKVEISITIFACYLTFYLAENEIEASGVLACVFLGLVCSKYKSNVSPSIEHTMHHVWDMFGFISNTLVFLFSGILIEGGIELAEGGIVFDEIVYSFAIYIAIHVTRGITIICLWWFLQRCGGYKITWQDAVVMWFGGLRGVIGLALGLITTLEVFEFESANEFKHQCLAHVSGVVLLTLIINATLMKKLVQMLRLDRGHPASTIILRDAMENLREETAHHIEGLKTDYHYSGADWDAVYTVLPRYDFSVPPSVTTKELDLFVLKKNLGDIIGDLCCCQPCAKVLCKHCYNELQSDFKLTKFENKKEQQTIISDAALSQKHKTNSHNSGPPGVGGHKIKEHNKSDVKNGHLNKPGPPALRHVPSSSQDNLSKRMSVQLSHIMADPEDEDDQKAEYLDISDRGLVNLSDASQFSHRILSVMRSSYLIAYEEGILSQSGEKILMEANDHAMDDDDLDIQYKFVRKSFEIAQWKRKWYESQTLKRMSQRLLFDDLSVAVEVGTIFVRASLQVSHVLKEIPEVSSSPICVNVVSKLDSQAKEIRELWLGIQRSYPEVYKSIQTKLAASHIIHNEQQSIEDMLHHGLLEESEYDKMMHELLEAQHRLKSESFFKISVDSKTILLNLTWVTKFRNDTYLKKNNQLVSNAQVKVASRGDIILKAGTLASDVIVIARGSAVFTFDNETKDMYMPGNMPFIWFYLNNRKYASDLVAQTQLEYFVLSDSLMKSLLKDENVSNEYIWEIAASNQIRAYFRDHFYGHDRVSIGQMCHSSTFFHFETNKQQIVLDFKSILLSGKALYPQFNSNIDSYPTIEYYEAPCLLLPSPYPYTFEPNSRVLILDNDSLPQKNNVRRVAGGGGGGPGGHGQARKSIFSAKSQHLNNDNYDRQSPFIGNNGKYATSFRGSILLGLRASAMSISHDNRGGSYKPHKIQQNQYNDQNDEKKQNNQHNQHKPPPPPPSLQPINDENEQNNNYNNYNNYNNNVKPKNTVIQSPVYRQQKGYI